MPRITRGWQFGPLFLLITLSAWPQQKEDTSGSIKNTREPEPMIVSMQKLRLEIPASFREVKDLATATQIDAPGRFKFKEGRGFFNPSTGEILQVYVSDNPLVGMNFKKAQEHFLKDFGGLSPRSWGLDTFTSMFLPWPKESNQFVAGIMQQWIDGKKEAANFVHVQSEDIVGVNLAYAGSPPAALYFPKVTSAALVRVKKGSLFYDTNFERSDALLGDVGMPWKDGTVTMGLVFRARTYKSVSKENLRIFSLPSEFLGKIPNFWWNIFSKEKDVFQTDNTLYHVVLATFDQGNPPDSLGSVMNTISLGDKRLEVKPSK